MDKASVAIIGAGAIGLAIGAELARVIDDVVVVERNDSFGRETSSRNSEVIHAGIYYPKDSLKLATCLAGKELLYDFCEKNTIPYRKIGKLIVATDPSEFEGLETLFERGRSNGVDDLRMLSAKEIRRMEPHLKAEAAIFSPSTGIFDTHRYMAALAASFERAGGSIAYRSAVTGITPTSTGYDVTVADGAGETFTFEGRVVVNCAGLGSEQVARLVGIAAPEYQLKYCKGDYFRVSSSKSALVKHLIYPVPRPKSAGLGIHATPDLAGSVRLGPDDEYVDRLDYLVDPAKALRFHESVRTFLPFIDGGDIVPDTSGIRPKLQGPGEEVRDFVIRHETDRGFPGFIDLIGIESPGLTGSLAIARMVADMVRPLIPT